MASQARASSAEYTSSSTRGPVELLADGQAASPARTRLARDPPCRGASQAVSRTVIAACIRRPDGRLWPVDTNPASSCLPLDGDSIPPADAPACTASIASRLITVLWTRLAHHAMRGGRPSPEKSTTSSLRTRLTAQQALSRPLHHPSADALCLPVEGDLPPRRWA